MAKKDEDGFIYLVDRKDVVISGGENIFPVEIENFLMTNDDIKDAAVIGMPDRRLGEIPVAVVETKNGRELTENMIIEFCQALPRYKRPRKVFSIKFHEILQVRLKNLNFVKNGAKQVNLFSYRIKCKRVAIEKVHFLPSCYTYYHANIIIKVHLLSRYFFYMVFLLSCFPYLYAYSCRHLLLTLCYSSVTIYHSLCFLIHQKLHIAISP